MKFPRPVSLSCCGTEAAKAKPSAPEVATVEGCMEGEGIVMGILGDHSSFSFARPWPTWEPEAVVFFVFLGKWPVFPCFLGKKTALLCLMVVRI